MRIHIHFVVAALIVFGKFDCLYAAEIAKLPNGQRYVRDEVKIKLKEGFTRQLTGAVGQGRPIDLAALQALHPAVKAVIPRVSAAKRWLAGQPMPENMKLQKGQLPPSARWLTLKLEAGADAADVVNDLRGHEKLEWASLSYVFTPNAIPNDPLFQNQWNMNIIGAPSAWDVSPEVTTIDVAVVDTGVDLNHPDLQGRISFDAGYGDFNTGNAPTANGGASHGTHVAGIIGAIRNNSVGVAGVARVRIMAMGCATWDTEENRYLLANTDEAIIDAVDNGAEAINCSFGPDEPEDLPNSLGDALDHAENNGVVIVAAAGNDDRNVTDDFWDQHDWPIIVSATTSDDTRASYSNFGNAIDISAPGGEGLLEIHSTVINNYGDMTGTSMATPHVTGAVGMIFSMNPNLIYARGAKNLLYRMTEDLGDSGKDEDFGRGRLRISNDFMQPLKNADQFVGFTGFIGGVYAETGSYDFPRTNLTTAISFTPTGGTLVLNAGLASGQSYHYPAMTITNEVTLMAFPDKTVTIGE